MKLGIALVGTLLLASVALAEETTDVSLAKEIDKYLELAAPEGQADHGLQWTWKDGPRCSSADGAFEVLLGGRLQFDSQWVTSDDYPADTEDASFFRRVRLEVAGHCYTNCIFKVQVDFASGTVTLKDVYVGLRNIGATKWGTFKAGHFFEPFGLEDQSSTKYLTFLERAAPTDAFGPGRNDGLGLETVWQKRYLVAVGVFHEANDQGVAAGDSNYALTLRAAGLFLEDEETHRFLHAGFSFSYRSPSGGTVRYRARPDLGMGTRFVDTGDFAANHVMLFGAELAARYRSFFLAFEFYWNDVTDAPGVEPTFYGYYVEVGYFLTGEVRGYKGFLWGRTKPNQNFFDGTGTSWGAWEIAFRYDYVDLSDSGLQGGRQACYTFGLNWYWNPNTRVMFNVIWADIQEGSVVEGIPNGELVAFSTRFAFDF